MNRLLSNSSSRPFRRAIGNATIVLTFCLLACWWRNEIVPLANHRPAAHDDVKVPTPVESSRSATTLPRAAPPSRAELIDAVRAVYRREQLTRELDLEQQRYGAEYWQAERDGPTLARLREARLALAHELTVAANATLGHLLAGGANERIALEPWFDDDHPGPNVRFLASDSRRRLEAELLKSPGLDRDTVALLADGTLTGTERSLFHAWNDRVNAATRNRLVGFAPTESEFLAIAAAARTSPESPPELPWLLGPSRYAALCRILEPGTATAIHDLDRAGLPPALGEWLAQTRQTASADVQRIWSDATLSTAAKSQRVAALLRLYDATVATMLSRPGSTIDQIQSRE